MRGSLSCVSPFRINGFLRRQARGTEPLSCWGMKPYPARQIQRALKVHFLKEIGEAFVFSLLPPLRDYGSPIRINPAHNIGSSGRAIFPKGVSMRTCPLRRD